MSDAQQQLSEYESQLAEITALLEVSPNDESLLALRNDLEELLQLTRSNLKGETQEQEQQQEQQQEQKLPQETQEPSHPANPPSSQTEKETSIPNNVPLAAAQTVPATAVEETKKTSKKKKKIKDFVVPPHLIATEEDSEQEKNRKRRALKVLKNKWRHEKKEVESANRQKSWQSFQKKTSNKRGGGDSIFSTKEGVNDRVGVISRKEMTGFSARKRHKY